MRENIGYYISHEYACLEQARILLNEEQCTGVRNRAYHAYFDTARALFAVLAIATGSHSAAHNLFSQYFVKENLFDKQDAKALAKLFDMRQSSDYDAEPIIETDEANYAVEVASEFRVQVDACLRENGFAS